MPLDSRASHSLKQFITNNRAPQDGVLPRQLGDDEIDPEESMKQSTSAVCHQFSTPTLPSNGNPLDVPSLSYPNPFGAPLSMEYQPNPFNPSNTQPNNFMSQMETSNQESIIRKRHLSPSEAVEGNDIKKAKSGEEPMQMDSFMQQNANVPMQVAAQEPEPMEEDPLGPNDVSWCYNNIRFGNATWTDGDHPHPSTWTDRKRTEVEAIVRDILKFEEQRVAQFDRMDYF